MFNEYAQFYDAYYKDKNYLKEVRFVLEIAEKYGVKDPKAVLDIGCGTARHLIHLAKLGLQCTGFDASREMIKQAQNNIENEQLDNIDVKVADATDYRDTKTYELVTSMFAAIGFISEERDFEAAIKTARIHLKKNGLFIFDGWFGPAVLNIQPSIRESRFEMGGVQFVRKVEPVRIDAETDIVETKNTITEIIGDQREERVFEHHKIRFFFIEKLKELFYATGFQLMTVCPFMDASREPTNEDWNISVVAKAV